MPVFSAFFSIYVVIWIIMNVIAPLVCSSQIFIFHFCVNKWVAASWTRHFESQQKLIISLNMPTNTIVKRQQSHANGKRKQKTAPRFSAKLCVHVAWTLQPNRTNIAFGKNHWIRWMEIVCSAIHGINSKKALQKIWINWKMKIAKSSRHWSIYFQLFYP